MSECQHMRTIVAKRRLYEFDIEDMHARSEIGGGTISADAEVCIRFCLDCQVVTDAWVEEVNGIVTETLWPEVETGGYMVERAGGAQGVWHALYGPFQTLAAAVDQRNVIPATVTTRIILQQKVVVEK